MSDGAQPALATPPTRALIGVGNPFRRDDGVGPALVAEIERLCLTGLSLSIADGEPTQLLDAWSGADVAVVVDAVLCDPSRPGRIHRTAIGPDAGPDQLPEPGGGTHGLGIPDALRLAEALDRAPKHLVILAVEAADLGFGLGLSAPVAAAVPALVELVRAELGL